VDRVICGLAAVDGFPGERLPADTRKPLPSAQVSKPLPREEACDADAKILPVGRQSLEKGLWSRWHMPVHQALSGLVQDAEGHGAGMQVNATIKWVLFGGEAPEVSSSFARESFPLSAD